MARGAYIFGCAGPRLSARERDFWRDCQPFGAILFGRNIETPDQLRALCGDIRAVLGPQAPIFIDQEGGRVERMTAPQWRHWLPPLDQVAAAMAIGGVAAAQRALYIRYRVIAHELREVGITGNCAPVLDVARRETHPILRNRCYGETPDQVAVLARAVAQGLADGGVLPVMKHIPGHGRGRVDSHLDLPSTACPAEDLIQVDFAPFKALADLPLGMTAHVVYEAFDDRAATVSPVMIDLIRREIGFDGLLMSDDISMQALSGTVTERALAARAAGVDVVLHCNGLFDEMTAIAAQVGPIDAAGEKRAQAAIASHQSPIPVDIDALEAELGALM